MSGIANLVPDRLNISAVQGDTITLAFTFLEEDEVTPIDVSDYIPKMQIRGQDDSLIIALSLGSGLSYGTDTNVIEMLITDTQNVFDIGDYSYDFQFEFNTGQIQTMFLGTFTIKSQNTL